jgi:hypothetical protein
VTTRTEQSPRPPQDGRTADPNPSQPVDLDYPTLDRLVQAEAESLVEQTGYVADEIGSLSLVNDDLAVSAITILDHEAEIPRSVDELVAQLNGIGATAYRLARHVRTLVEFRKVHLEARADREAGRR